MRWVLIIIIALIFFNSCSGKENISVKAVDENAKQELRAQIVRDVSAGFDSEKQIVESVVELLSDDYNSNALRPLAADYTQKALARHLEQQQTWPQITDCDRLDRAFAQLENVGIVCRHDFSCCGTCGAGVIWDEIEKVQKEGKSVRGYAFYHMQDTESAIEGHGLFLNYGATEEGEKAALLIANEIADLLRNHNLQVEWDGTWEQRIGIKLDWKRRRAQ